MNIYQWIIGKAKVIAKEHHFTNFGWGLTEYEAIEAFVQYHVE